MRRPSGVLPVFILTISLLSIPTTKTIKFAALSSMYHRMFRSFLKYAASFFVLILEPVSSHVTKVTIVALSSHCFMTVLHIHGLIFFLPLFKKAAKMLLQYCLVCYTFYELKTVGPFRKSYARWHKKSGYAPLLSFSHIFLLTLKYALPLFHSPVKMRRFRNEF